MPTPELTLKQKINLETAKISWKELAAFFAKGVLLQISPEDDLVEVAEQIASNQQDSIENLIVTKKLEFVTARWVKTHCVDTTSLWAVVVAPYVLCQLDK